MPIVSARRALLEIVIVYAAVLALVFGADIAKVGLTDDRLGPTLGPVVHVLSLGVSVLATIFVLTLRDPDRLATLGLRSSRLKQDLAFGCLGVVFVYVLAGLAVGLFFLVTMRSAEHEATQKAEWLGDVGKMHLAAILPLAIFAGVYEEIVFRGFFLGRLRILTAKIPGPAILGTGLAIVLSSAMFAAGHAYQGALGLVQTFAAGAAFAVLTTWRKSIWPSIIAHISIDTFALVAAHFLEPALKNLAK